MTSRAVIAHEAVYPDNYFCEVPSDPCAIVMFGASGDLAKRKLLPALYDLAVHSCLAPRFRLLGFARTSMSDESRIPSALIFCNTCTTSAAIMMIPRPTGVS
jgi:hypothetical protein